MGHGARSRERASTVLPYGPRQSAPGRRGRRLTVLRAKPGTNACSATRGLPSRLPRLVMLSTLAMAILRFAASAVTRIRLSRWTSCAGRRQRRSMSSSATCAARIVRRSAAARTSAAISWRCGPPRFRRMIGRRRGGRAIVDVLVPPLRRADRTTERQEAVDAQGCHRLVGQGVPEVRTRHETGSSRRTFRTQAAESNGPMIFAWMGMMQAINRHHVRKFDTSLKPHHWRKRRGTNESLGLCRYEQRSR
jgi:hypothetical protein